MLTLFALGGVWGSSFLFIKVIVEDTGPLELVVGRMTFGAIAIAGCMVYMRRAPRVTPRLLGQMSVMSLFSNVIPFALIAWGEEHIESGTASLLNATVPIFTAVIAAAVLADERFTSGRLIGLALGFLGVAILTADDLSDVTDSNVLGQLAVVLAAVCYGGGAVYARTLLRGHDPVNLSILQVTLGALFAVPLAFVFAGGVPDTSLEPEAWASVVALGVFGTGFGYIAWLWLIEHTGSVRASLVTYIVPIIAVVLGWLVLDEGVGLQTLAGGAVIVAGVANVMRSGTPARRQARAVATESE